MGIQLCGLRGKQKRIRKVKMKVILHVKKGLSQAAPL